MFWFRQVRRSIYLVLASLATLGGVSTSTIASDPPGVGVAHLRRYLSPSSIYALGLDPHDWFNREGAVYHLSRKGVELWSDEKPYTLGELVVTDKGLVVGFAYRVGPKRDEPRGQLRRVAGPVNPPQYLHVVILGADGNEILNDVIERAHPPWRTEPPPRLRPYVEQFLVDSANDRVIVRLVAPGDLWWIYRLSTGESLGRFDPMERVWNTKGLGFVVDVRPIAGTPLLLVQWCLNGPDDKVKGLSARFALLDTEFKPVWSFDAVNDYAALGFHRYINWISIRNYFKDYPAILVSDVPGRFEIRLVAENEEVSFSVKRGDGLEYEVAELGRVGILIQEKVCIEHLQTDE